MDQIEEKFSRCPRCDYFTVEHTHPKGHEKLLHYFTRQNIYICSNCSLRFHTKNPLEQGKNKVIWISFFGIIAIAATVTYITLSSNSSENIITPTPSVTEENINNSEISEMIPADQTSETTTDVIPEKESNSDQENQTPGIETADEETDSGQQNVFADPENIPELEEKKNKEPPLDGEIIMRNSSRYGVNWRTVINGIKITRLTRGPFLTAGIKIGDIIVKLDNNKNNLSQRLMSLKQKIYFGRHEPALLEIIRDNKTLFFILKKADTP